MFLNETGIIGTILQTGTTTTTGSLFLSLLILVIIIIAVALMFQIPLEFTSILILPLLLSVMAYYSKFLAVGGVIFIYLAFIVTNRFLLR